ncbi:MAG: magnetosome biogenesis CDF transporter MamB [Magnetococcales bacterium]|nr:magnetosome biogenesis CDF transporter MamB [Magnetococcales bacterium]MBF0155726.1 magnetosome biogenesis CDF transporter MamB [Magnetococcales bacterium]
MKYPHCGQCRDEVTWYSIWFNVFMVVYKVIMSLVTNCAALMADAFHSLADLLASVFTLVSLRISDRPADEKFAYGYGKIQHISSGIVGLILVIGSIFILVDALVSILNNTYATPDRMALVAAVVSTVGNELMFHYQRCVAIENNSPAIMANAWDNRSDAFSSVGMVIGLFFATILGFPIADPLAAILLSLLVIKIGLELIIEAVDDLMDAAPDVAELEGLHQIIRAFPRVGGVNYLRARSLGEKLYIEADIRVDKNLKVYEGDVILAALREKILLGRENVGRIQFYLTPEVSD